MDRTVDVEPNPVHIFVKIEDKKNGRARVCIKNITFYFQLQSETCNIFVTLLNKIVKNTVIHY